jgi:hypothetical protein
MEPAIVTTHPQLVTEVQDMKAQLSKLVALTEQQVSDLGAGLSLIKCAAEQVLGCWPHLGEPGAITKAGYEHADQQHQRSTNDDMQFDANAQIARAVET